jgi:hypothetical protein
MATWTLVLVVCTGSNWSWMGEAGQVAGLVQVYAREAVAQSG